MMNRRLLRAPIILAIPLAFAIGACSENLETGAACPTLCPGQKLEIIDTIIDPVVAFDTSLAPFPILGLEDALLLASRGDTLDLRAVVRFDTLVRFFRNPTVDSVERVSWVDSATLNITLNRTSLPVPDHFFIDAYQVADSTVPDTVPLGLVPHFTAARLLGSLRVDSASLSDSNTFGVPLDSAMMREILEDSAQVLRIGLQIRANESVEMFLRTSEDPSFPPRLRYLVSPDSGVSVPNLAPTSGTPTSPLHVSGDFLDYPIVVRAPSSRIADRMYVGGMPSHRTYLRFDVPSWLTDSVAVLRARLELVQDPVYGLHEGDTIKIRPEMVIAGHGVLDLRVAAGMIATPGLVTRDSLVLIAGDSGSVSVELNALLRHWRTSDGTLPFPTAIVLRTAREGYSSTAARFFGSNADPSLRPRLHISYVPAMIFGQP